VESKPSIWKRKELTVSSLGRTVAGAAADEDAAGLVFRDGGVWATTIPDNTPVNKRAERKVRCMDFIFWNLRSQFDCYKKRWHCHSPKGPGV
jgi:hypothetical protein